MLAADLQWDLHKLPFTSMNQFHQRRVVPTRSDPIGGYTKPLKTMTSNGVPAQSEKPSSMIRISSPLSRRMSGKAVPERLSRHMLADPGSPPCGAKVTEERRYCPYGAGAMPPTSQS
jgi:hypothetical protein